MTADSKLALFLMLGQSASRTVGQLEDVAPPDALMLSAAFDLAPSMPDAVRRATRAAYAYKLFFVFETYLREFVVEVLSRDVTTTWWDKLPADTRGEIERLEDTEETKSWMALGSRDKSALMTYPQLLHVMDQCWKLGFDELVRDKALILEARMISHLRNTICHMTAIPEEEVNRIRQVMRDWFRVIAP